MSKEMKFKDVVYFDFFFFNGKVYIKTINHAITSDHSVQAYCVEGNRFETFNKNDFVEVFSNLRRIIGKVL